MASEDPTARAVLRRRVNLEMADSFVAGWQQMILLELDSMRQEMPYADTVEISLICERRDR